MKIGRENNQFLIHHNSQFELLNYMFLRIDPVWISPFLLQTDFSSAYWYILLALSTTSRNNIFPLQDQLTSQPFDSYITEYRGKECLYRWIFLRRHGFKRPTCTVRAKRWLRSVCFFVLETLHLPHTWVSLELLRLIP